MTRPLVAGAALLALVLVAVAALADGSRPTRYVALAAVIALCVVLIVAVVPAIQSSRWPRDLDEEVRIELRDKSRATLVQLLGAVGLVATAAITLYQIRGTLDATERTLALTEQGQAAERFSRSIDQLGAVDASGGPAREVRLGGLYALQQYAERSERDRTTVGQIIAAYIRRNGLKQEVVTEELPSIAPCVPASSRVPVDIGAALDVLRAVHPVHHEGPVAQHPPGLDLSGAGLVGADLSRLDLRGANLTGSQIALAHLDGTVLDDAQLGQLDARSACFLLGSAQRARFARTGQFTAADIAPLPADLRRAAFLGTDLTDAEFFDADLRGALLDGVDISGAHFGGARLRDAGLKNLRGRGDFACGGPEDLPCSEVERWQASDEEVFADASQDG